MDREGIEGQQGQGYRLEDDLESGHLGNVRQIVSIAGWLMLTSIQGLIIDGRLRLPMKLISSSTTMVRVWPLSIIYQEELTRIAWDGYQANRQRLLQHIYDEQIDNVFAVTGDTHANWLFENNLETTLQGTNDTSSLKVIESTENTYQRGTVVEFGGTAVSSNGWGNSWGSYEEHLTGAKAMVENNPTLLYADAFRESTSILSVLCRRDDKADPR